MKKIALILMVLFSSISLVQSGIDKGRKGSQKKKQHKQHTMKPTKGGQNIVVGSRHKGRKSNNTIVFNKQHGQNGSKNHKGNQMKKHNGKDDFFLVRYENGHHPKGHSKKNKYHKGHPNYAYFYVNEHGFYSGSNYGHWRSAQAKKKHKHYHPKHEHEAVEVFNIVVIRNNFLLSELSFKIELLRSRLRDKRKAGSISLSEMNRHLKAVDKIEKRRSVIEVNLVVSSK